jgi:hypothetical protein
MNITISYRARLGNFLQMITNAIHIGLYYNYNVRIPSHPFFNTTYLVINEKIKITAKQVIDKDSFFIKKAL